MTAAEILCKAGINSLPVDLARLSEAYDIKIVSYETCAECYDIDVHRLYSEVSPMGFSFREEECYIAAVNHNACGKQRRRWTAAHELAHILLGHVGKKVRRMSEGCERSADELAAELLAPSAVLHFCGVSSAEELGRLCGISKQAAEIRFGQLTALRRESTELYRRKSGSAFLQTEWEQRLMWQMTPFVSEYITRRSVHDGYGEYLKRMQGGGMVIG